MGDIATDYKHYEEDARQAFLDESRWDHDVGGSTLTLRNNDKIQIKQDGKNKWRPIVTLCKCPAKEHPDSFASEKDAKAGAWSLFKGLCLFEVVSAKAKAEDALR
jgi:hypothetical protein